MCARSCATSWRQQRRRNMLPSSSTHRHRYLYAPPWLKWGKKKGPTAIQVDNSTAVGIATKEFRQNKSKSMDMRFYWVNNRIEQGQFRVLWRPGPENLGYYHSKHHPPEHHIAFQYKYLHFPKLGLLQGCVDLTVRVNSTKQKSQRAELQRYFLVCIS